MPNWCNNSLTITHKDVDKLENLMSRMRDDEDGGFFNHIKPMPEKIRNTTSPDDSPNWYDWSCDNWGTKWDAACIDQYQYTENTVGFSFDTAWSPPIPIYEELTKQGFEVQAYYVEFGMMYAGSWYSDENGKISGEHTDDIDKYVPPDVEDELCIKDMIAEWREEETA